MIKGTPDIIKREALDQYYLECFGARNSNEENWRESVVRLIHLGIIRWTRQTGRKWSASLSVLNSNALRMVSHRN